MGRGHILVSSDRLEKLGIPGLQGMWFIHYTTAAPNSHAVANIFFSMEFYKGNIRNATPMLAF